MRREIEGILARERDQPVIKTDDGKTRLVYNLFDGFTGKRIKLTLEEIVEEEEEEEGEETGETEEVTEE